MPVTLGQLAQDDIKDIIKPTVKNLNLLVDLNIQLLEDTQDEIDNNLPSLLNSGKINQGEFDGQMTQCIDELEKRQEAKVQLAQRMARFDALSNADTSACLVISATTTRDELKILIAAAKKQRDLSTDEEHKIFLETVLATAEGSLTWLTEKGSLPEKSIPLTNKERDNYLDPLMLSLPFHSKKLNELEELKNAITSDTDLKAEEKSFLFNLCVNLQESTKEIFAESIKNPDLPISEDTIQKYDSVMAEHLEQSAQKATQIQVTEGFKGFLNKIAGIFSDKPVFTMDSQSAKEKIQDFKSKLTAIQGAKAADPEVTVTNDNTRSFGA